MNFDKEAKSDKKKNGGGGGGGGGTETKTVCQTVSNEVNIKMHIFLSTNPTTFILSSLVSEFCQRI